MVLLDSCIRFCENPILTQELRGSKKHEVKNQIGLPQL